MKVLNLYAGIGGNRKLWQDVEVTAVEYDPKIAAIYQDFFPNDTVIVGDAHQYLLDHYKEYNDGFIWASPPCPTHSRFNFLNSLDGDVKYPEMSLYQEIILLQTWFKGKYCIENVISYYEPLITPTESNNHYFWTNFRFPRHKNTKRGIRGEEMSFRADVLGIDVSGYTLPNAFKKKILNNCTEPELGLSILNAARGIIAEKSIKTGQLF